MKGGDKLIKSEVFPVNTSAIPKLHAYEVKLAGYTGQLNKVGGKLAYRFKKKFGGLWAWVMEDKRLITDLEPFDKNVVDEFIEELWESERESFKNLERIEYDKNWIPTPIAKARYVTKLFDDIREEIKDILLEYAHCAEEGNVCIERLCKVQAFTVKNGSTIEPAISISISSRLVHKQDLKAYAEELKRENADLEEKLIDIWVCDKFSSFKGKIVQILGELKDHRRRLHKISSREEIIDLIEKAPDDELVVRVKRTSSNYSDEKEYDYIASVLRMVVRTEDVNKLIKNKEERNNFFNELKIEPYRRYEILGKVFKIVKSKGWIKEPYDSQKIPNLFIRSKDIGFEPTILIGNGVTIDVNTILNSNAILTKEVLKEIKKHGIYHINDRFKNGNPIKIGVINTVYDKKEKAKEFFEKHIKESLKIFGFEVEYKGFTLIPDALGSTLEAFRSKLNEKVKKFEEYADILLVFLPGEPKDNDFEDYNRYDVVKEVAMGLGLQSQVVYERTIGNENACKNIALGIIGKTGNIPYILGKPLDYADLLVGIDVSREKKDNLPGTINVVTTVRIYNHNGKLLHYSLSDKQVQGETIPREVLNSLINDPIFKNKKVIIHRDGPFRGNEIEVLEEIARELNSEFYFIEVIKNDVPRIYEFNDKGIQGAKKGTVFKLNDREAILITSSPQKGTSRPIRIRTDGKLEIEKAIHSVLSMTILHYGSLIQPRLPVTTYYADKIAGFVLRGIKPKEPEGNIPFWL